MFRIWNDRTLLAARRSVWLVVGLLLLATGSPPLFAQQRAPFEVREVGLDQHLDQQLPLELKFRNEQGDEVRLGDYFGEKPVVLNFVYYRCPMLCTQVLNGLLKATNSLKLRLDTDYEVVSISIDPRETPAMAAAKKQRYVLKYQRPGAEEGWHFLTGDEAAIEEITRVAGFRYKYDPQSDQYAHASGILVVTPQGRISRYFYGIDYHPTDLRLGLVESSNNQIGSPVDQFLLLCYHYDPLTGKYGLIISRVIQGVGSAFALCLGGFLWTMYRQERRRSSKARSDLPPAGADSQVPADEVGEPR
jgi:protein SCO1/2